MKKGLGIGALGAAAFVLAIAFATAGSWDGESEALAAEATLDDEAASMGHASAAAQEASIPEDHLPRWTADGGLQRPESWQEWVMVGASIGLNYSEEDFEPVPSDDGGFVTNATLFEKTGARIRVCGRFGSGSELEPFMAAHS